MRKNFFRFIIAFAIIFTAGIFLSSCGGGEKEQKKQVDFTIVSYVGSYTSNYDAGTKTFNFSAGTEVQFSASDFSVLVTYSDRTTKTLEAGEYTVDLSGLPGGVLETGSYSISVSEQEKYHFYENFTIIISNQKIDLVDFNEDIKFTYDGTEKDILAKLDEMQVAAGKKTITELKNSGLITLNGDAQVNKDAGHYYLDLGSANGYVFNDGSSIVSLTWDIEKVRIPIPTIKVGGAVVEENDTIEFTYQHKLVDGNYVGIEQGLELDFGEYDTTLLNEVAEISNVKGTNAGNYSFNIYIKDAYQKNYTLNMNEYDSSYYFSRYWSISPMEIEKPSIENGDNYHYTYTPELITPVIDYHGLEDLFRTSGDTVGENATTYAPNRIAVSFKEYEASINYKWSDNSEESYVEFFYYVDKADYILPNDINENLIMEITFEDWLYFKYNDSYENTSLTEDTLDYLKENDLYEKGDFRWANEYNSSPTIEHATGDEYITAKCTYVRDYFNYNPSDELTVKIKVNPKEIILSHVTWNSDSLTSYYYYNNQEKINGVSNVSILGNEQVEVATTTYYKKVGEEYQQVDSCVTVGDYKTIVTFVPTNPNRITDYFIKPAEKEWSIEKAPLTNLWFNWAGTAIDEEVRYYRYMTLVELDGKELEAREIHLEPSGALEYALTNVTYQYFKGSNSSWVLIDQSEAKGVGVFRVRALLSYDTDNLIIDETCPEFVETEFEIVSRTIDASTAAWEEQTEFVYDRYDSYNNHPKPILPAGTYATDYWFSRPDYSQGNSVPKEVGTYSIRANIEVIGPWKGYIELLNSDAISEWHEYHIVPRELSDSDFDNWTLVRMPQNLYTSVPEDPETREYVITTEGSEFYLKLSSYYTSDTDIEYTTTRLSANSYRTTAVLTTKENNQNVTIDGESITVSIDWKLALEINSDISKEYDGTPVSAPEYSLYEGYLSQQYLTKVEYKLADAADDTYTEVAPTEIGEYVVKVTLFYYRPWDNVPVIQDYLVRAFSISEPSTTN